MSNNEIKIISGGRETFEVIHRTVNKMVDFIRPTYGPASNKVIISTMLNHETIDDGARIAAQYELPNPVENAIVKEIRQVSSKTNDRVGDGTTGSLIMLQAMINEVARKNKIDGRKIELELTKGFEEFKEIISKSAKKIKTLDELKKVARISFDNERISGMIAELYYKLGPDGLITIDKSSTMETTVEMTEGVKLDSGYVSPYMINNPQRMESVIEKPYILITDYRLTEANDLLPLMNKMAASEKRNLVVIAENIEQAALATAVVNNLQGKFYTVAINAPSGQNRKVLLEDLALLTGAKLFSESKGDKLESAELDDLGRAEQFICKRAESLVIGPKGKKNAVRDAVAALRSAIKNESDESSKKELLKRLGLMTGSLAVIKVGAATDSERKALKEKVEDAVHAVKAAYKSGVVCGAGRALAQVKTSSPLLNEALKYPARQLAENMGLSDESEQIADNYVMNVVTGQVGPFMSVGVMDPVDVLIAGVESAVSIAKSLVTSSGMMVQAPKQPTVTD